MEARKITIILGNSNSLKTVITDATTLGELKEALRDNGIQYEGMSFMEGLTRTELKDDSSLLPKDVVYKGNTTNDLVFMLTRKAKLKSGSYYRTELFNYIRENNLQDSIKESTGRNFTNCSNNVLASFVNSHKVEQGNCPEDGIAEATLEECAEHYVETLKKAPRNCSEDILMEVEAENSLEKRVSKTEKAIEILVEELSLEDYIDATTVNKVLGLLQNDSEEEENPSPYSEEDLQDMFRFLD